MRVKENYAKSAVEEADTEIRSGAEAEGAEREKEEAEARDWDEADIREEAERRREEAGDNAKAETEAAKRERA